MATLSVRATAENSTKTTIQAGNFTLLIDEPPLFGGENAAPSPVEFLLASIAGCLNAIGQYVAKERGISLRHLDIAVEGDCNGDCFFGKSDERRAGFQEIRIRMDVDCDAAPEELVRWREQVLRRCPVLDNLRTPVPILTEVAQISNKCRGE